MGDAIGAIVRAPGTVRASPSRRADAKPMPKPGWQHPRHDGDTGPPPPHSRGKAMHHQTRVRLLGPVTVHGPDGPIPVGGRRAQRLLATLALNTRRTVSAAALIDAAWAEEPPATCRDQVNNCLSGIRRRLAVALGEDVLHRVAGGFQLRLDDEQVDANLFRRQVPRPAGETDARLTAARLRTALALWTGDALEGIAEGTLAVDATRLDEVRLAAYEELFAVELRLGPATSALIGEMASLAGRHPLREQFTWHLMTAMNGAGRTAEALSAYEEHRRSLHAEIGVEPDATLRNLAAELRRGRHQATPPDPAESLATLMTRLSDLAQEVAWRLESGV
jgi:DNA-binding SARP family transcriptional activator